MDCAEWRNLQLLRPQSRQTGTLSPEEQLFRQLPCAYDWKAFPFRSGNPLDSTLDLTLVVFKNHTYRFINLENGEAEVRALCNTPEGYHWTGYANGVVQVTDSKYQTVGYLAPGGQIVPNQVPFCPYPVYSIFCDTRGRMWIGTKGDGLYVRSHEGVSHYEHNPANKASLPHNDIYDIVADRHGRIWVATHGGGLALAQEGETGLFFYNRNFGLPWPKNSFADIRRIF